jgi:hypothetical protein
MVDGADGAGGAGLVGLCSEVISMLLFLGVAKNIYS